MKVIFLYPYPLDESPSQRFRFEQYFPLLRSKGIECVCQSFWNKKTWNILYLPDHYINKILGILAGFLNRLGILFQLGQTNIVFIHRESLPIGPPLMEWIIAKILRKKIIYDFDDAIWLSNTSHENTVASFFKQNKKVYSICRWSYKISCGNSYLGEFASQLNAAVVVNPTTIDTDLLHNPALHKVQKRNDIITIGWTGSHSTIPYLSTLFPVFSRLNEKFPDQWRLLVIADKAPDFKLDNLEFKKWSKETEIEDLLQFDIGIMPLIDDAWARGKCGFKSLQYMSLEIPALASPVGVNQTMIDQGINGYLCTTENDWLISLEQLMFDPLLRKNIGARGREKVVSNYSVISNSSNFLGLFSL